jgi:hypothetical protein
LIDPFVRPLDILENSVVQISNIAANSMSLQTAVKNDIAIIFEKLNATKASGSEKSVTHILESQLNEKNKVIERLNKEMSECKRTVQEDLVKLVSEHECQIKSLQFEHQKLLSEKVKCEMENERLDLVLQNIESATSDMKSMYEARLNEKDKTIERTEFKTIFMMLMANLG